MKGPGRPKKPDSKKAKYHMLAVRKKDYQKFAKKVEQNDVKIVDAFSDMVKKYPQKIKVK